MVSVCYVDELRKRVYNEDSISDSDVPTLYHFSWFKCFHILMSVLVVNIVNKLISRIWIFYNQSLFSLWFYNRTRFGLLLLCYREDCSFPPLWLSITIALACWLATTPTLSTLIIKSVISRFVREPFGGFCSLGDRYFMNSFWQIFHS